MRQVLDSGPEVDTEWGMTERALRQNEWKDPAGLHHAIRYALDCLHMGDVAEAEARLLPAVGFLASRERWHEHLADLREAQGLPRGPAATPPRSWHYVTEKLPSGYLPVLFWLAVAGEGGTASQPERHVEGWFDPRHGFFVSRSSGMRYRPSRGEAYAWQLLPEVPPLPEDKCPAS